MRKLTKFITTALLSLTGLGVFSASIALDSPAPVMTSATDEAPDTVYIALASGFADNKEIDDLSHCKITIVGGDYACTDEIISTFANRSGVEFKSAANSKRGFDYLKIPNNGSHQMTYFRLYDNYDSSYTGKAHYTINEYIPTSENGLKNLYVLSSKHGHNPGTFGGCSSILQETNQWGCWTYFDDTNAPSNSKRLYFVPSEKWYKERREDNAVLYPYLKIAFTDSSYLGICASGVTDNSGTAKLGKDESGVSRNYVFYFENVPTQNISSMTMYFNYFSCSDSGQSESSRKCSLNVSEWTSGKTIFTTNYDDAPSRTTGFYYADDESHAFLSGSFSENPYINWNDLKAYVGIVPTTTKTSGGRLVPTDNNVFRKKSNNVYSITTNVDKGDYFIYTTYDYLTNVHYSGDYNDSSWDCSGLVRYDYDNYDNITVLDENVESVDKKDYIKQGSNVTLGLTTSTNVTVHPIEIKKAGVVEFIRSKTGNALTMKYISGERADAFGSVKPNLVIGEMSDISMQLMFNFSTHRYETIVVSLALSEKFKYAYDGGTVSVTTDSFGDADDDRGYNLVDDSADGYVSVKATGGVAYYCIGWTPVNTRGTGSAIEGVEFFIEKITDISDYVGPSNPGVTINSVQAVEGYGHRIALLKTCNCGSGSTSSDLKKLYDKATYSGKDNALQNITFSDYDYTDYVFNGKSYEGLNRTVKVNAYDKHLWIQYLYNGGAYPSYAINGLENSFEYQESNNIIVIVVAATSLAAIASLAAVNFIAIKKRKQKR